MNTISEPTSNASPLCTSRASTSSITCSLGKATILTPTLYYRGDPVRCQDCEVVNIRLNLRHTAIAFKLRSPAFAAVEPGQEIERLGFVIEERQVDILPGSPPSQTFKV